MLSDTYIFSKSSLCKMTGLHGFVPPLFILSSPAPVSNNSQLPKDLLNSSPKFPYQMQTLILPLAEQDAVTQQSLRFLFLILKCFPSFIPCEIGEKSNCPHCLMHHNSETHSILVILNPSPAGGSWISDTEYEFSTFKSITLNSISVKGKPFLLWQKGFPYFHWSPGELNSLINETRMQEKN